jgi:hypothetical protein
MEGISRDELTTILNERIGMMLTQLLVKMTEEYQKTTGALQ